MSQVPPNYPAPDQKFLTLAQQDITTTGLPGAELDAEFGKVATSLNQTISRLGEIQGDNGGLKAGVVTRTSLNVDVATGVKQPAAWVQGTAYNIGDTVIRGDDWLICIASHTATDLATLGSTSVVGGVTYFNYNTAYWSYVQTFYNETKIVELINQYAALGVNAPFYQWSLTGNGTSTAFGLSVVSGQTLLANSASYIVTVGGVLQTPDKYTISSTANTITFVAAPPNTVPIYITCIGYARQAIASVTNSMLQARVVTSDKIALNGVTGENIAPDSVTNEELATDSVYGVVIKDEGVDGTKIAKGSITYDRFAAGAVNNDALGNGSVTPAKLSLGGPSWTESGLVIAPTFQGYFKGNLQGNADTTSKLISPRTITLSGWAAGSTTFDGSSNVTISTTAGDKRAIARAWVTFTNTGLFLGTPYNVSSVTYVNNALTGTGLSNPVDNGYKITFVNAMSDTNYCIAGFTTSFIPRRTNIISGQPDYPPDSESGQLYESVYPDSTGAKQRYTSYVQLKSKYGSSTYSTSSYTNVVIFGNGN